MINQVTLVGRLTKDPELRYTPNGVAVASFTLAVNRTFKTQGGEREADFIQCVVWRTQAENLANYQKKGSQIGVTGRIQTRNYDGQDGKRVYVTEVVCENIAYLEPKKNNGGNFSGYQEQQSNQYNSNQQRNPNQNQSPFNTNPNNINLDENPFESGGNNNNTIDISDDDLPF